MYTKDWMMRNFLSKYFAHMNVEFSSIIEQHLNQTEPEEENYEYSMFGSLFIDEYYDSSQEEDEDGICASDSCKEILEVINDHLISLSWATGREASKEQGLTEFTIENTFLVNLVNHH